MKLFKSTFKKITKVKNSENVPYLEVTEVVLLHCIAVNKKYHQDSKIWYAFLPNK